MDGLHQWEGGSYRCYWQVPSVHQWHHKPHWMADDGYSSCSRDNVDRRKNNMSTAENRATCKHYSSSCTFISRYSMGLGFWNTLQGENQIDKYISKVTKCNSHILWWFLVEMQVRQLLVDLRHTTPLCLPRWWHNIASIKPPLMRNCPVIIMVTSTTENIRKLQRWERMFQRTRRARQQTQMTPRTRDNTTRTCCSSDEHSYHQQIIVLRLVA